MHVDVSRASSISPRSIMAGLLGILGLCLGTDACTLHWFTVKFSAYDLHQIPCWFNSHVTVIPTSSHIYPSRKDFQSQLAVIMATKIFSLLVMKLRLFFSYGVQLMKLRLFFFSKTPTENKALLRAKVFFCERLRAKVFFERQTVREFPTAIKQIY